MSHVQGLLTSRAAVLLKIGKVQYFSTFLYGYSLCFNITIKGEEEIKLDFNREENPYNEAEVDAVLKHLDEIIAQARKEAQYTLGVTSNWEA